MSPVDFGSSKASVYKSDDVKLTPPSALEPFPQSNDWTNKVPANDRVYGKKTVACSDEEWQVRVDLAAAYRQCYRKGLCEGIVNHLTAAIPGTTDRFLVFPFGLMWSEVRASNLLVVDGTGNVVQGNGEPEATAFYIHASMHKKHPKGMAVMHTHQTWASAICALEDPQILMINQNSLRFYKDFVIDSYNGLVLDPSEGNHLADAMGDKRVLMHQNHGVIVCAESIALCFDSLYFLERTAKLQVLAMSTGKPLRIVSDPVAKQFKDTYEKIGNEYARLHFEALKREMLASECDRDFIT